MTVQFTDESDPNGSPITSWDWDFGDGSVHATTESPVYEYFDPGDYTVRLTVRNGQGAGTYTWVNCVEVSVLLSLSRPAALVILGLVICVCACALLRRRVATQ